MNLKILNKYGEKLDALAEGNNNADVTIIFAHGYGTDKNEGMNLFVDIGHALEDKYRILRFDFSGYGESEGKQEEIDMEKHAEDLHSVIKYAQENFKGKMHIIAHSRGTSAVSLLNPDGIEKAIFTGIPNLNPDPCAGLIKRIESRGNVVDMDGITLYKRISGQIQKIGPSFWEEMKNFDGVKSITEFSKKTKLTIIHPIQDEIVGNEFLEEYKNISNANYLEVDGDHNFSKFADRKNLIEKIKEILG